MPEQRDPLSQPSATKQSTRDEAARFLQAELAKQTARANGLEKEKIALIQEYVLASDEEAPDKVKKNIRARVPDALQVLDEIMLNGSSSDGVRASIAKWYVDRGLAPDMLGGTDSTAKELARLLGNLSE